MGSTQNLIIYFAGHGKEHEKAMYLVPTDAKEDYKDFQYSKFISHKQIFNWIDNRDPWHIVLILDACHAGRIINAKRSPNYKEDIPKSDNIDLLSIGTENIDKLKKNKSRWVITSGSDDETVSDGKDEEGSPFSQLLIQILENSVKRNIPLSIASIAVLMRTHLNKKFKQNPDFRRLNNILDKNGNNLGEFVFEPKIIVKTQLEENNKIKLDVTKTLPEEIEQKPVQVSQEIKPPMTYALEPQTIYPVSASQINSKTKQASKKSNFILYLAAAVTILLLFYALFTELNPKQKPTTIQTFSETPDKDSTTFLGLNTQIITPTVIVKPNLPEEAKTFVNKRRIVSVNNSRVYDDKNTLSAKPNLVFTGSFENKSNAEAILGRLKTIGYDEAEIIMKEKLPYATVVTGFYRYKSSAKAEVKALRKKGIEVYYSGVDLTSIYRKKD